MTSFLEDPPDLDDISFWRGDVQLSNAFLKPSACNGVMQRLRLPFRVIQASVHELRVKIPFTTLTSSPCVVDANHVQLLLHVESPFDPLFPGVFTD